MRRTSRAIGAQESELEKIVNIGKKHRQLGLYLYIYWHFMRTDNGVPLHRLHRFYNRLAGRVVHENTVRKQLELLEAKGLIEVKDGKIYPKIVDLEAALRVFDLKRSRAGKIGAMKTLRRLLYTKYTGSSTTAEIPEGLKHYIAMTIKKAKELVQKGKREVALDLLVHVLLPVRETGALWIWRGDEFIYFERKNFEQGSFYCVKFSALAKLLKELGFEEGVMLNHIYGHREAKRIIHKLFARGPYSWPWARSVFYELKKLDLASEGNYYILEYNYNNKILCIYLRDYYGNIIKSYEYTWIDTKNLPPPLDKEKHGRYIVIGKQHTKEENENSYFSKWSR